MRRFTGKRTTSGLLALALALALAPLLTAAEAGVAAAAPATSVRGAAAAGAGTTASTVYTETNDADGNQVAAYRRGADGTLSLMAKYATGGAGSGVFENTDTMVVVGSAVGESSPVDLGGGSDLLFVADAGSDDIAVFRIASDGSLNLVGRTPTGQERPTSLTVRNGLVYVMNSAGDSLPGASFCFGGEPTITGFRVTEFGALTPIADSTRQLPGGPGAGCTQIQFDPTGKTLVVSQFGFNVITTFALSSDGTPGSPIVNQPAGKGPFGLNFDARGRLLTTDDFEAKLGQGATVSYTIGSDSRLTPIGGVVSNGQTDTCWIVHTPDNQLAFASSFGPEPFLSASATDRHGAISSYRINGNGTLSLIEGTAASLPVGAADLAVGGGGRDLYVLNTVTGEVLGYQIGSTGSLTPTSAVGGLPAKSGGQSGGLAVRDTAAATSSPVPSGGPNTGAGGTAAGRPTGDLVGGIAAFAAALIVGAAVLRRRKTNMR